MYFSNFVSSFPLIAGDILKTIIDQLNSHKHILCNSMNKVILSKRFFDYNYRSHHNCSYENLVWDRAIPLRRYSYLENYARKTYILETNLF